MYKKCWIDHQALQKMHDEAMMHSPLETGGTLMGYQLKEKKQIVITDLVGPGPKAEHEANSYLPDNIWQSQEVRKIFDKSKGRITYIGDWHTHPESPTILSGPDVKCLKQIANYKKAYLPNPIMLIMGFRNCTVIDVYGYPSLKSILIETFDFECSHA